MKMTNRKRESECRVDSTDLANDKEPSDLFRQALRSRPTFESKEAAIACYTDELESLATKLGKPSVDALVLEANSSIGVFNADFERALSLAKRIAFLKHA